MSLLSYDKDALAQLCRNRRIRRLALFGSVLKGTDRSDSDVDLLVEFEPEAVPGFLGLAAIEAELAELLGRRVDLRTAEELSPYFRQAVERTAEVQFVA
ncbi:MAG: nucleotidyltransferase domain-containing protein [Stellaceae bacterium]